MNKTSHKLGDSFNPMMNLNILLVEDDPRVAETLVRILQREFGAQAEITACVSAEDALMLLKSDPFHLLVSDHDLPRISGMQLIAEARAFVPELKIIFMTAVASERSHDGPENNADLYLVKPFKPTEMIDYIRRLI